MRLLYAEYYVGLNQTDKAIQILVPNLLENGLADNTKVVNFIFDLLSSRYKIEELKNEYKQSFRNVKTRLQGVKGEEYEVDYITFFTIDIVLDSWIITSVEGEEKEKEIERIYSNSLFYKKLYGAIDQ